MSANQHHGKDFESQVLSSFGVTAGQVPSSSVFDIPLGITTACDAPASIKTADGCGITARVYLSDASRIWGWPHHPDVLKADDRVRLIVGLWDQLPGEKLFHSVWDLEFSLKDATRTKLFGQVTFVEIKQFHEDLKARKDELAICVRAWAFCHRAKLEQAGRLGIIRLDPKIDSKRQRRLQCSALLTALADVASKAEQFDKDKPFPGLTLPLTIKSTPRARSKKQTVQL